MNTKVSSNEVEQINNAILDVVNDEKATVSTALRSSFYFKGRKSEKIAAKIIELLTKENDIILEPFFGGGSFILAALEANRYVTGIELDNYTYDIFTTLLTQVNLDKLSKYFDTIKQNVRSDVMYLYRTNCCGEENYIQKVLFDPQDEEYYTPLPNREIKDGKNIIMIEKCSVCGNKAKKFDDFDAEVLKESEEFDTSDFPNDRYIENSRINITKSTGAHRYDRVFTERNKYALLLIQEQINALPDSKEKHFIQHALVTSLALAKISMYGSSTDILYHVVNSKGQDMNVWYLFESKFNSMLKFQQEYSDFLVEDVTENQYMNLQNGSYDDVLGADNNCVDLIYTDFPYTDQVPYLERHQLFRVWLNKFTNSDRYILTDEILNKEIVLTNAPSRPIKNSMDSYYNDIDKMMSTFYQVLKEDKYMVFTMKLGKNKHIQTYSEIVNLARKNGFEYVTRVSIQKTDPTLRKQSAYANTFMNEVIVVFKKLSKNERYWYENDLNYEFVATKLIYNHISLQEDKTVSLSKAVNLIRNDLLSKGFISTEEKIQLATKVVQENFDVDKGFVYIDSNRLYLNIEDETTLFMKLFDLIPLYIKELLQKQNKFVLEDLYLELTNSLFISNPNTLAQLIDDDDYQQQINTLIENYCDIENGYYVEKEIENTMSEGSEDISQYTGSEFEELIKKLLMKEGYYDPVIMGGAGDRGVDIIAKVSVSDNEVEKHIFQCKRWISNVGSEPIQRLYAEMNVHDIDKAFCVTTSDYTPEGKKALDRFDVEGWNGWDVQEKLNKHFPNQYFNRSLKL
ncbi:restriction endonuclease [Vagococcus lutrae]|uniref:restriction endonuclease n=1 Tax=Vagococcus lutrae TaxID=81947 RepID=UPI001C9721A1|nr:restriction endonuclease [Vagococcus lutrae]QZN88053.1 restriction endonuclease [Vagococcus lutrae]